ncbi:hypothetical protein DLAC_06664 [Tieghemostelium lacteum]|uniref:Uncharacterized protein n=1 Tax=Tieghemostelium lacteum TaxID=361077 RepID=A0A151ZFI1_TIELA|nr:hypothetical protein DLAC_06664 [Tieghemostelium lacteum]|eukprot:KYQ92669.1 hypothetical protein DLAC_06664 [Tieghemostelium lacteum]
MDTKNYIDDPDYKFLRQWYRNLYMQPPDSTSGCIVCGSSCSCCCGCNSEGFFSHYIANKYNPEDMEKMLKIFIEWTELDWETKETLIKMGIEVKLPYNDEFHFYDEPVVPHDTIPLYQGSIHPYNHTILKDILKSKPLLKEYADPTYLPTSFTVLMQTIVKDPLIRPRFYHWVGESEIKRHLFYNIFFSYDNELLNSNDIYFKYIHTDYQIFREKNLKPKFSPDFINHLNKFIPNLYKERESLDSEVLKTILWNFYDVLYMDDRSKAVDIVCQLRMLEMVQAEAIIKSYSHYQRVNDKFYNNICSKEFLDTWELADANLPSLISIIPKILFYEEQNKKDAQSSLNNLISRFGNPIEIAMVELFEKEFKQDSAFSCVQCLSILSLDPFKGQDNLKIRIGGIMMKALSHLHREDRYSEMSSYIVYHILYTLNNSLDLLEDEVLFRSIVSILRSCSSRKTQNYKIVLKLLWQNTRLIPYLTKHFKKLYRIFIGYSDYSSIYKIISFQDFEIFRDMPSIPLKPKATSTAIALVDYDENNEVVVEEEQVDPWNFMEQWYIMAQNDKKKQFPCHYEHYLKYLIEIKKDMELVVEVEKDFIEKYIDNTTPGVYQFSVDIESAPVCWRYNMFYIDHLGHKYGCYDKILRLVFDTLFMFNYIQLTPHIATKHPSVELIHKIQRENQKKLVEYYTYVFQEGSDRQKDKLIHAICDNPVLYELLEDKFDQSFAEYYNSLLAKHPKDFFIYSRLRGLVDVSVHLEKMLTYPLQFIRDPKNDKIQILIELLLTKKDNLEELISLYKSLIRVNPVFTQLILINDELSKHINGLDLFELAMDAFVKLESTQKNLTDFINHFPEQSAKSVDMETHFKSLLKEVQWNIVKDITNEQTKEIFKSYIPKKSLQVQEMNDLKLSNYIYQIIIEYIYRERNISSLEKVGLATVCQSFFQICSNLVSNHYQQYNYIPILGNINFQSKGCLIKQVPRHMKYSNMPFIPIDSVIDGFYQRIESLELNVPLLVNIEQPLNIKALKVEFYRIYRGDPFHGSKYSLASLKNLISNCKELEFVSLALFNHNTLGPHRETLYQILDMITSRKSLKKLQFKISSDSFTEENTKSLVESIECVKRAVPSFDLNLGAIYNLDDKSILRYSTVYELVTKLSLNEDKHTPKIVGSVFKNLVYLRVYSKDISSVASNITHIDQYLTSCKYVTMYKQKNSIQSLKAKEYIKMHEYMLDALKALNQTIHIHTFSIYYNNREMSSPIFEDEKWHSIINSCSNNRFLPTSLTNIICFKDYSK